MRKIQPYFDHKINIVMNLVPKSNHRTLKKFKAELMNSLP